MHVTRIIIFFFVTTSSVVPHEDAIKNPRIRGGAAQDIRGRCKEEWNGV
jgi:hypothetical protein